MLFQQLTVSAPKIIKRNIGILAPVFQEAKDPIQKLFLDKIREYKAKSSGGKLVDVTPEIEKERQAELDRVKKQFNIKGDPTEFPKFKFQGMLIFQTTNCNI
ncbi:ATP synthase-coupling factor 6, mitochondrial-like isoform X1 [Apis cerana]|uniref:ATP synthase-coupling factor 6, mitochondrial-like isoform X1 n=1 Tax=Apis cerana TaxID=7461 RepID=UPI002B23BAEE|nr:ATP synthase-coupling factor 6, mitochondrial-like isoform X1 [Apis cerana]